MNKRGSTGIVASGALISLLFFEMALPQSRTEDRGKTSTERPVAEGGRSFDLKPVDAISDEEHARIQQSIDLNIRRLTESGVLPERGLYMAKNSLIWPTRKAPGVRDFNIGQIPYFVDQNPAYPGQVLDWNCGNRTYDNNEGYNHRGTDIVSFPFPWKRMENNEVQAVAAASGRIIFKSDGNPDQNCSAGNFPVNSIHVVHDDGSVAWYLHLKKNSLTKKRVGSPVRAGEVLGIVGSSGSSSVPHLHFELYDWKGDLQDPYEGPCNSLNSSSWWADQEPYRNSQINTLLTGSAPPEFPACPATEITNEKTIFRPTDTLVTSAFYRDMQTGQETKYQVLRPNGSVFANWNFVSANTFNANYRFRTWQLGSGAPRGRWRFRAEFNGETYEVPFTVNRAPFDFDGDNRSDLGVYRQCWTDGICGEGPPQWWILRSSDGGPMAFPFATISDLIVPADYTGDGKTDVAVYRGSTGEWIIIRSEDSSIVTLVLENGRGYPAPGDFDGDGKADAAVFDPLRGVWQIRRSSDQSTMVVPFGQYDDRPVVADYDGDGLDDIAVYRRSTREWWLRMSTEGIKVYRFGINGEFLDRPVVGDYTGDGKADIAFYHDVDWYILRSEDDSYYSFTFGQRNNTLPAPGDYDGDGKLDPAVYQQSAGIWFVLGSQTGVQINQFGIEYDRPVQSAYALLSDD